MPVTVLKKGSFFGEIALLRNTRRSASVRALSETLDLFALPRASIRDKGQICAMKAIPATSRIRQDMATVDWCTNQPRKVPSPRKH